MNTLQKILDFEEGMKRILITPAIAAIMLKDNIDFNRNISNRNKNSMSNQMKNGLWKEDINASIVFSKTNKLLDGQHRLSSIISSGKSINMWVCNNMEEETFDVIDTGKMRSLPDIFSINNVANSNKVAATTTVLYCINSKKIRDINKGGGTLSNHCMYQYYKDRERFLGGLNYKLKINGMTSSIIFSVYGYLLQFEKDEIVDDFFHKIKTGSDLYDNHPIMTFRNQLVKYIGKSSKDRPLKIEYIARLLKTFYFFKEGEKKKITRILWNSTGKESFPYHKLHKDDTFAFKCID